MRTCKRPFTTPQPDCDRATAKAATKRVKLMAPSSFTSGHRSGRSIFACPKWGRNGAVDRLSVAEKQKQQFNYDIQLYTWDLELVHSCGWFILSSYAIVIDTPKCNIPSWLILIKFIYEILVDEFISQANPLQDWTGFRKTSQNMLSISLNRIIGHQTGLDLVLSIPKAANCSTKFKFNKVNISEHYTTWNSISIWIHSFHFLPSIS